MHCSALGAAAVVVVLSLILWKMYVRDGCIGPPVYRLDEDAVFESANNLNRIYADSLVYVYVHPRCACDTTDARKFKKFARMSGPGAYFFETDPSPFIQPPTTYDGDLPYVARFSKGKLTDVMKPDQLH